VFQGLTGIDMYFVVTLSVIAAGVFAGYLLR
jgi:hypothetical protein